MRIGLIYVEWSGEQEIVALLERYGYTIFDSVYMVGIDRQDLPRAERLGFRLLREQNLSIGQVAFQMLYDGTDPVQAMRAVYAGMGWVQTDLIAVNPTNLDRFLSTVSTFAPVLQTSG